MALAIKGIPFSETNQVKMENIDVIVLKKVNEKVSGSLDKIVHFKTLCENLPQYAQDIIKVSIFRLGEQGFVKYTPEKQYHHVDLLMDIAITQKGFSFLGILSTG